jgi:hypothetical protein
VTEKAVQACRVHRLADARGPVIPRCLHISAKLCAGIDQFVLGPVWTSASGFQDVIWDLEDGVERIDLRGAWLSLADLTVDDAGSSAIITSVAGRFEVVGFGQTGTAGRISADDFIFD